MDQPNSEDAYQEPANIRFLRRLVTVLTAVMICGLLVMIALFVTRLGAVRTPLPLPQAITLPDGTTAQAFTQASDWYAVVTTEDEILIFDRASGELRQRITVE